MPERSDHTQIHERLKRAVRKLPRRTREVFLAHLVDHMPYDAIAEQTGLTLREIERHIADAIYAIDRSVSGPPLRWWERWLRW